MAQYTAASSASFNPFPLYMPQNTRQYMHKQYMNNVWQYITNNTWCNTPQTTPGVHK
jgi:hypothetical protein